MEVETKTLPVVENTEENSSKKGKILTLLFPPDSQPAEEKESRKDKNKTPTKVVVRRLPPRFTKDDFTDEFSPLPAHDYFHFVRGDLNLGSHAFSRAYINFLNQEDIYSFKEKYDDYDLQDEKGRTYHVVVEFAPFQKIPKWNNVKKKLKSGTLETDPKYLEFLQKLEESKNFNSNPSEYFHETENCALKTKVVTTPLLEFLKRKRHKKIDLRNELRQRKKEAERERKRKEEEKRKTEREKRKEEKKNADRNRTLEDKSNKFDEKIKEKRIDDRGHAKEEKKELKNRKNLENDSFEEQMDNVIPNDPAILEVVVRRPEKDSKPGAKDGSKLNEETKNAKTNESDVNPCKFDRKYTDFRSRIVDEKQKKNFYKRDSDESKIVKTNQGYRKGAPDEKGDNYSIGNCADLKETTRKSEADPETKRHDFKHEIKETKSKFRYSEQRNRDREYRQKTFDCKTIKDSQSELKNKYKDADNKGYNRLYGNTNKEEVKKSSSVPFSQDIDGMSPDRKVNAESVSFLNRRKSFEMERELVNTGRKRSKSFSDISSKELYGLEDKKKLEYRDLEKLRSLGKSKNESSGMDDNTKDNETDRPDEESKKDPRTERRIRNKDRPSLEIYRPGMGKFSKQRLEQKKEETNCTSPTRTSFSNKSNRFAYKSNTKKGLSETKNAFKSYDQSPKSSEGNGKSQNEVRTMMFTRSVGKEIKE